MNERERIEYLIEAHGLTSSQFADKTGIPRASVSHILSGRNKPSLEILQKVAAVFPDVDLNWLMMGAGEPPIINIESQRTIPPIQEESLFASTEDIQQFQRPVSTQKSSTNEQQTPKQQKPAIERSPVVQQKPQTERTQRKSVQQRPQTEGDKSRKIKEIRVFYSDGTYEILIPEK